MLSFRQKVLNKKRDTTETKFWQGWTAGHIPIVLADTPRLTEDLGLTLDRQRQEPDLLLASPWAAPSTRLKGRGRGLKCPPHWTPETGWTKDGQVQTELK